MTLLNVCEHRKKNNTYIKIYKNFGEFHKRGNKILLISYIELSSVYKYNLITLSGVLTIYDKEDKI